MALLQGVVERRLLEVDLARFPKTLLAFLFLAGKRHKIDHFCYNRNFKQGRAYN